MEKPQKPGAWAFAVIVSFLALLLAARGITAIVTRHFESTARYSGPYTLDGMAAVLCGAGYVFLSMIVLTSLGMQLKLPRRTCIIFGAVSLAGAILCFGGSLLHRG